MSDSAGAIAHPSDDARATMSPFARAAAVFVSPGSAWRGLESRAQWFYPLLFVVLVMTVVTVVSYERVIVPMQLARIDEQVASGELPAEAAERAEAMMTSPAAKWVGIVFQGIAGFVLVGVLPALLIWLGVSFILGVKLGFRRALEVASWSALVSLPGQLLAFGMGWFRGTLEGVHTGFGALLPESESPSGVMRALGQFLDMIGPLGLWYVAVVVLGAAALSGAPTRRVAWVLGGLYLAVAILTALGTAVLAR